MNDSTAPKPLSAMKAIASYCKNCGSDEKATGCGTWAQQIEDCTITHCELYHLRPLTSGTKKKLQEERISRMTPEELLKYRAKQDAAREQLAKTRESNSS